MDNMQDNNTKLFRHFLSEEISEEIHAFSKIHQYDDRHAFKEAWQEWLRDDVIGPMINDEVKRIRQLGYKEDVLKKMFVSARYYYRKMPNTKIEENVAGKDKKPKIGGLSKEILANMDTHMSFNASNQTWSPQEQFNDFCLKYRENIEEEIKRLKKNKVGALDPTEVILKFKKSYKNRYYNIRKMQ